MPRFFVWIIAAVFCTSILTACFGNDGSNAADDDDSVIDDDTAGDDDSASDDDSTSDNDVSDDDAVDDDTGSDPGPRRLLLTGAGDGEPRSWEQTENGWREWEIPASVIGDKYLQSFGPTLIMNGKDGYSAINNYWSTGGRTMVFVLTLGQSWLKFDAATGWRADEQRPPAGGSSFVQYLQAPEGGAWWAVSEFRLYYVSSVFLEGIFFVDDAVYRYDGLQDDRVMSFLNREVTAFAVPTGDFGLAWVSGEDSNELWRYDGVEWSTQPIPDALQGGGAVAWFWLTAPDAGYAILWNANHTSRSLLEMSGGEWTEVPAPEGCDEIMPSMIYGDSNYAVAFASDRIYHKFWELRDGSWRCREIEVAGDDLFLIHAVLTADQQAYLALQSPYAADSHLFLVTAGELSEIDLPGNLERITGVHLLGEGAPPVSFVPASVPHGYLP